MFYHVYSKSALIKLQFIIKLEEAPVPITSAQQYHIYII